MSPTEPRAWPINPTASAASITSRVVGRLRTEWEPVASAGAEEFQQSMGTTTVP